MSGPAWSDANLRVLTAEFARLRARLSGDDVAATEQAVRDARAALPSPAAIDVIAEGFGLTTFERDVLLFCAGVEMDAGVAAACGLLCGNARAPHATFAIALEKLPDPHWSALTPVAPLRRWQLIAVEGGSSLAANALFVDERVLHYLTGVSYLDPRLSALVRMHALPGRLAVSHSRVAELAAARITEFDRAAPVVQLVGDDRIGQLDVAASAASAVGLQLHVLRAADLPSVPREVEAFFALWQREALLIGSALAIEHDGDSPVAVARSIDRATGLVFVVAARALPIDRPDARFEVDRPEPAEQKALWLAALGEAGARMNGQLDGVSAQFRFGARSIARTAEAFGGSLHQDADAGATLWNACRESTRARLDDLAQRIEPSADWGDLVLPDSQLSVLGQIAAHVRQRLRVYGEWGFARKSSRGLGISVLFAGESGTGKTMAAEVLARALNLDLYRVDLAAVVSKYIGETEKNLARVFDAAEESGVILLFDEADALFGKRSEVKSSHDRYANVEVSYLLQRMEAYRGLAILTTNLGGALDPAFQRRLRFSVQFPFPDQALRERIWRGVFPAALPLDGVDHGKLARLNMAGGNIRNIAINAAFLAAESGSPLGMGHLLQAARSEATKRDRALSDAETRGWT